ncbi:MAG: D-alanine--D-alanine ligase [Planctomycetota bacterium]
MAGGFETGIDIGIAADLRPDVKTRAGAPRLVPEDRFEEYDSLATVEAIAGALTERGHRPRFLGGGRRFLQEILARPPELVFNMAEGSGTRSREAHVPAVCEMLGVPFTGSDPLTLATTLDKAVAKRLVASAGLATPRFEVFDSASDLESLGSSGISFPCIAKPLREGSSMGIRRGSRADDAGVLREEIERLLADYQEPVLVEEFLPGAEFTVGVLGEGEGARALGVMEIEPLGIPLEDFVYSLEVKRNFRKEVAYHVPPRRSATLVRAIEELALASARALGCRDLCRVDLRLGEDGAPRFLEANPLPGLAPGTSDVVILAGLAGISYADLIDRVVKTALARLGRSPCHAV